MRWSLGRGKYGQTDAVMDTCWQEFAEFLKDAGQVARHPDDKESWWWFAPFLLKNEMVGVHRRNEDVQNMGAVFCMDLDRGNLSIDTMRVKLTGLTWLAYTTAQSTYDAQRWRVAVLTDRECTTDEHWRVWQWFAAPAQFGSYIDERCKNVSRIYYLPADWTGADNVWYEQAGTPCKLDGILALVPETPPPAPAAQTMPTGAARRLLTAAPNGTVIVTNHMLAAAMGAPEGGRLIALMGAAAKRFRINGWELSAVDLATAAEEASVAFSPNKKRTGVLREAQRALDWAERNFSPLSDFEKMRNRILWDEARKNELLKSYKAAMSK